MTRAVIDTNVLISGLLSGTGPCGLIVDLVLEGLLQPCVDGRILAEYEEVMRRPQLAISPDDGNRVLGAIRAGAEPVVALPWPSGLPDVDDLAFLEVAAAAGVSLVTGNPRHYPEPACRGVAVVSPREFVDRLRHSSSSTWRS